MAMTPLFCVTAEQVYSLSTVETYPSHA